MRDVATKTIVVVTTGGTIAGTASPDGAIRPTVDGSAFIADAKGPADVDLRLHDLMSTDSARMSFVEMDSIAAAVATAMADESVDGVVILHGTDTMQETAMLVDLQHDDPRPVVFTGAQRPADHSEPDGPGNLTAAITLAADIDSRGRGVLISFGDEVVPARGARKVHTTDLRGFDGTAADRKVLGRCAIAGTRVDIVTLYPGVDATAIDAYVEAGASGLVLEAMGSGNANPTVVDAVRRSVATGVTVVVTSRVHEGPVAATYGGGGGGVDLVAAGALVSTILRASQSRILLAALLAHKTPQADIADWFSTR